MSDLISQNVNVFLRSVIKAVGHFVFMWGLSWRLTLVAVMGFPFVGLVSQLYGEYYKVGQGWGQEWGQGEDPGQAQGRGQRRSLGIKVKGRLIF